jgi:PAS domain S-box-containing protein
MEDQNEFISQVPDTLEDTPALACLASDLAIGMVFELADGTIQACNAAAESILGFTLTQMQNSISLDLWQTIRVNGSPFPRDAHPAMVALRTGRPVAGVVMGVYQPNGTLIWIKIDAQPLFQATSPTPWAVVATFWEIPSPKRVLAESVQPNMLSQSASQLRTVLLVDDCAEDWEMMYRYLRRNSEDVYQILVAEMGAEGLEICRTTPLDLVVLDNCLPDCDAINFLTALHKQSRHGTPPVIVVTGHGDEEIAVQLLKAGVKDYLVKGRFSAHDLQSVVGSTIHQAQLTVQLRRSAEKERLVTQIAQRIHHSLDLDDVLQATVQEVNQFLQTDRVLILRFGPDLASAQVMSEAVEAPWTALLSSSFHDHCFAQDYAERYRQGRVSAVADFDAVELEPCYREFLRGLQVRANLIVPILRDDALWGLLVAHHCCAPRSWQRDEIDLLKQLATQVGIALHRVELYQQTQIELLERRRVEHQLRESQERLQLGVQIAGVALAKFDYAADTVTLSPEAAALYGLPADALVVPRDRLHATFHPDERAELLEIIQQVLDPMGAGWFARDHRVVWQSGEVRWLTVRKQVFFDSSRAAARPIYAILAALDITERKQADLERERLLHQEQAARTEAERANQIKDEFLAVLSHELRSPLNPILGWTTLLQRRKLDEPRTQEALATIERNAKLQAQLIDDLLDISCIMRGKLTLNAAPVNLTFVISAALETVRLAAAAKRIQIDLIFPSHPIQVFGDAGRLQQVVWNLLSNAVKFTPSEGQVHVELTQQETQAQIQVRDTGKGISPEFLPYIFEHFRQEDGATTRKFGGLGLGLAIARQIVELHGGRIYVTSLGENQGATFTVQLPLLQAKSNADPTDEIAPFLLSLNAAPMADVRALVVDDDPDTRNFLAFLLEEQGASVTVAPSAIEALQALEQNRFDVLLSDIGMPEMDGYMLIRAVRSWTAEQGGKTPAIALTAYAREDDQKRAISSGFQQHLSKPIDPVELVNTVARLAQRESTL